MQEFFLMDLFVIGTFGVLITSDQTSHETNESLKTYWNQVFG